MMQRSRGKKGISTIIAAVFMIAVIVLGLSALTSGLGFQNKLGQVVTERSSLEGDQIKERIEMKDFRIDGGKLNMTLVNTGMLPVKIVRAWVTNTTAPNGWHTQYDNLNYLINPGDSYKGFGQQLSLVPSTSNSYEIKTVTERGTVTTFRAIAGSQANVNMVLTVVPPSIVPGQNATVILYVINDQNDVQAVHDISPILNTPTLLNCGGGGQPTCPTVVQKGSNPQPVKTLLSGSTAAFKWTYNIGGTSESSGAIVRFTAVLGGNSVSDDLAVTEITITQTNFASQTGTLTVEFESLKWLQNGCTAPVDESDWNSSWRIPAQGGGWTAFKINVTNHDPDSDIVFDKRSAFILAKIDDATKNVFYIASNAQTACGQSDKPTKYDYDAYSGSGTSTQIIIPKKEGWKVLYFAAGVDGDDSNVKLGPTSGGIFAGNFVLLGKLGSTLYGQNLPFMGFEACSTC